MRYAMQTPFIYALFGDASTSGLTPQVALQNLTVRGKYPEKRQPNETIIYCTRGYFYRENGDLSYQSIRTGLDEILFTIQVWGCNHRTDGPAVIECRTMWFDAVKFYKEGMLLHTHLRFLSGNYRHTHYISAYTLSDNNRPQWVDISIDMRNRIRWRIYSSFTGPYLTTRRDGPDEIVVKAGRVDPYGND